MIVCLDLVRLAAFRPVAARSVPQNITVTKRTGKQLSQVMDEGDARTDPRDTNP